MNTPSMPQPASQPAKPPVSFARKIISWVLLMAVLAAIGVVVYMRFFSHVKISDGEIVRFSGRATRAEARKVGEGLLKGHVFDGESQGEAIIHKDAKGYTLTLVTDAPPMPFHNTAAAEVAKLLGADSIVLRYSDNKGNISNEHSVAVSKGAPEGTEDSATPSTQPSSPSTRPRTLAPPTRPVR